MRETNYRPSVSSFRRAMLAGSILTLSGISLSAVGQQETGETFKVWLPRNRDPGGEPIDLIEEIRVALFWDADTERVVRQFGSRKVPKDDELQSLIRDARQDFARLDKKSVPVIIDASSRVPWRDILGLIGICRSLQIAEIEFAMGEPRPADPEPPAQSTTSRPAEAARGSAGAASRPREDLDRVTVLVRHGKTGVSCDRWLKGLPCSEDSHWVGEFRGEPRTWSAMRYQIQAEARRKPEPPDPGCKSAIPLSGTTVVIRAEPTAPYGHVQQLLEMCGRSGIYKIEVGALKEPSTR